MRQKLIATMVASAFGGVAGVASAGPISVASIGIYAVEAMGTAVTVKVGNVAYTLTNPFAVSSTQTVRYTLDTKIGACPTVTVSPAVTGLTIGAAVQSADKLNCSYTFTTDATNPVPANATINFASATAASSSPLATEGGKINATVAVLNAGLTVVENNSAAVAQSSHAFTASIVSSSTLTPNPERSQVNVATTPIAGTAFTAPANDATAGTTQINLGRLRYTETPGVQLAADGATEVNFANLTALTLDAQVKGPFLIKAANGNASLIQLHTTAACGGLTLANINPTSTDGAKFVAVDISAAPVDANGNKDVYICYNIPAANNSAIPTGQFTSDLSVNPTQTVALSSEVVATTNIYNLTLNGVQVDIRNYVPNGFAGWFSAYRIINTGQVAAAVTGQFIGQDGALVGSALPITASIPVGGVVVVGSAAIEGVLGSATPLSTGGVGPRLRLTAPTDSIRVQAFACQPSGPCFLNSDAQGVDALLQNFPADGGK